MKNPKYPQNALLARLPEEACVRLRAELEPVNLKFGQVLYEPGKSIRHVYFPANCLIS